MAGGGRGGRGDEAGRGWWVAATEGCVVGGMCSSSARPATEKKASVWVETNSDGVKLTGSTLGQALCDVLQLHDLGLEHRLSVLRLLLVVLHLPP